MSVSVFGVPSVFSPSHSRSRSCFLSFFFRRRTPALGGAASPCRAENLVEHVRWRGQFLLDCADVKLVQLTLWMFYVGTSAVCMNTRRSTGLRWLLLYSLADFGAPRILTVLLSCAVKQLAVAFPTLHCVLFGGIRYVHTAAGCLALLLFFFFVAAVTLVHNPANASSTCACLLTAVSGRQLSSFPMAVCAVIGSLACAAAYRKLCDTLE